MESRCKLIIKKRKKVICFITIIIAFVLISSIASYIKLGVLNPFSSGYGTIRTCILNKPYTVIQKNPQVIMAQPDDAQNSLLSYMNSCGYTHAEDERLGSILLFEKDGEEVRVDFSVNRYYSLWAWID